MRSTAGLHEAVWRHLRCARRTLAIVVASGWGSALAQPTPLRCVQPVADFLDVQGVVEYRGAAASSWSSAATRDPLCAGDTVRVSAYGQTRIRLGDGTILTFDRNTSATFSAAVAARPEAGTLIELLRGLIHVISRDPRSLQFNTPYVNAGLEGTEFTLAVDDESTAVAVVEGTVALSNELGRLALGSGARATADANSAPLAAGAVDGAAILAWTGHIPRLLAAPGPAADAPAPTTADGAFYAARAAARLRLGLLEPAQADIAESLRATPDNARALALRSLVELAANDRAAARATIERALARDPQNVASLLAASYVRQASNDRGGARAAIDAAFALEPSNHLVVTRLAELLVAAGDADAGLAAAERALALDPGYGRAHAVRGFAHLMQAHSAGALEAFARAVGLDPGLPLARVGFAIAHVQTRDVAAARAELEVAVALDPRNAVLRSYVAKTYATQNRAALSATQLELARRFDPLDPTPWLYGAIEHQQQNRSVQALWELESTAATQIRSSLSLDEDLGARNAGIGRLYRSLGFNRLAMQRGAALVQTAPDDFAGHQLLADVYPAEPRHQIARVNEQYTAQLLRPINLFPVQPQAVEANLFLVDQLGPSDLASTDLGQLFTRNGLRVQASGISAANDSRGLELAVAGLDDRVSFSAGYFDYETDGFRDNNDLAQRVASGLVQLRADEDTSWLFELRSAEIARGDLALLFDRDAFSPLLRIDEANDAVRLGLRHQAGRDTTWLVFLSRFRGETNVVTSPFFRLDADIDGYSADLQRIFAGDKWRLITGIRRYDSDRTDVDTFTDAPVPFPPFAFSSVTTSVFDLRHSVLYGYGTRRIAAKLDLTLGIEAADLLTDQVDARSTMPRLGLTWQPSARTQLRASVGEHLLGPSLSKFTIDPTVAPTAVAGFNHYYFGPGGELSWQRAVAVEHEFSERLHAGIEAVRRELEVPTTIFEPTTEVSRVVSTDRSEAMIRGHVYWTPTSRIGLSFEYLDDDFDNAQAAFTDSYAWLETRRLPVTLSIFHGPRLSTRLRSTYVEQSGLFGDLRIDDPSAPGVELVYGRDEFWVADLELGYRLANRRGTLALIVANLFDETFRFQDADPENPRIMPERVVSLRFTLAH